MCLKCILFMSFICSRSQSPKSFSLFILLYESTACVLLICHLCLILQQLMRERQQMASRPFASVDVSLEARGEETEVLQPVLDVSLTRLHVHIQIITFVTVKLKGTYYAVYYFLLVILLQL